RRGGLRRGRPRRREPLRPPRDRNRRGGGEWCRRLARRCVHGRAFWRNRLTVSDSALESRRHLAVLQDSRGSRAAIFGALPNLETSERCSSLNLGWTLDTESSGSVWPRETSIVGVYITPSREGRRMKRTWVWLLATSIAVAAPMSALAVDIPVPAKIYLVKQ